MSPSELESRKRDLIASIVLGSLLGLSILLAAALSGCGGSPYYTARQTLATTARLMASVDRELAEARVTTSDHIRMDPNSTLDQHRAAMQPFDEALAITMDIRDGLLATQSAIDAVERGEHEEWLSMLGCAVASIQRLYELIQRRGLFTPDATVESIVDPLIQLGAMQCQQGGE